MKNKLFEWKIDKCKIFNNLERKNENFQDYGLKKKKFMQSYRDENNILTK